MTQLCWRSGSRYPGNPFSGRLEEWTVDLCKASTPVPFPAILKKFRNGEVGPIGHRHLARKQVGVQEIVPKLPFRIVFRDYLDEIGQLLVL